MRYQHVFTVRAPLEAVREFHRRSASMGAITPPPVIVRVQRSPALLGDGDEMEFTLWLGPLPLRWLARIEQVTPVSFVDRQVRGPFAAWVHRHTFVPAEGGDGSTVVIDDVEAVPSAHWFWGLVGRAMWLNLPVLFAYRGWKTRRILERVERDLGSAPA